MTCAVCDNTQRIRFEKPDLVEMTKNYTVVDLHFHSRHSDGSNSIEEIARYARELNIGIAITDHNAIDGAVEIDAYKDVLSIPGIEVTSLEGAHIIVYFYDIKSLKQFYAREVRPFMGPDIMSSTSLRMEEIIVRARHYRSVVIFPHPSCAVYTGVCNTYFPEDRLQELFKMVDGVEVINSGNLKKQNLKCALLGFNLDKAITGGSDGHLLTHMGRVVTYADCRPQRRAFLEAVKRKRSKVIGKEVNLFRKMTANGYKLKSSLRNSTDLIEKNMKYGYAVLHTTSKALQENVRRSLGSKFRRRVKTKAYRYGN
ncbi:MAG: PHP domain-containing protein [Desulfobacterales bacterium]